MRGKKKTIHLLAWQGKGGQKRGQSERLKHRDIAYSVNNRGNLFFKSVEGQTWGLGSTSAEIREQGKMGRRGLKLAGRSEERESGETDPRQKRLNLRLKGPAINGPVSRVNGS